MICSLRAQIELGDYCPNPQLNYGAVLQHCLPPRILPLIGTEVVALHHQSLFGMTPQEAKQAFFNIIQSWPLHKATFYDVMVRTMVYSFIKNVVTILKKNCFVFSNHLRQIGQELYG